MKISRETVEPVNHGATEISIRQNDNKMQIPVKYRKSFGINNRNLYVICHWNHQLL